MQNGAISFSCCVDANDRINDVIDALQFEFKVLQNTNLELATIRHYNDFTISEIIKNKEILLEQKTRNTIQFVLK
jgi:aspartate kinase